MLVKNECSYFLMLSSLVPETQYDQVNAPNSFFMQLTTCKKPVTVHCFLDYKSNQLSVGALLKSREIYKNGHAHKIHACCIEASEALYFVFLAGMKCCV